MKQTVLNNLKNIYGWKTNRKIIVISVDDYGNVRLDSKKARKKMNQAGLKIYSRFDAYDSLETREDLEMLFETLSSAPDKNGNPAMFTPFALPCNIDFEKMRDNGYKNFIYETLPETYEKLESIDPIEYKGTWPLWKEGINKKFLHPQFHGREHLNLKVFNEKVKENDYELMTALKNRSFTSMSSSGYSTIGYTAAFEFWNVNENEAFNEIISDGLERFEDVFGFRATQFNPPGGREHPSIHPVLKKNGIKFLDAPLIKQEHLGRGKYRTVINFTGKKNDLGMFFQVRNVVFEPTENRGFDWVNYALKQIEAAFFWSKPAIISSHRVNFCGHISSENRKKGLTQLKDLLQKITRRWPDVEFLSSSQLNQLIEKDE